MGKSKERWVGIAAGIAVVALLALAWNRAPKTVGYETFDREWDMEFNGLDHLHVNDRGVVVGVRDKNSIHPNGLFQWDPVNGFRDIGKPDGMSPKDSIEIVDFNNKSQILVLNFSGNVYEDPNTSFSGTYFYDPQTGFKKIHNPPGYRGFYCNHLNDLGQAVGAASRILAGDQSPSQIFLWEPETGPRDLNLSGWVVDMNNSGHILGMEGDALFLWTPEQGRRVFEEFPYGPVLYLQLSDADEIFGIADSFDEESKTYRFFRWTSSQGYQEFHSFEKLDEVEEFTILAVREEQVLYYTLHTPFNWFGLFPRQEPEPEAKLYIIGEGLSIPRNMPFFESFRMIWWDISRNGWIAGSTRYGSFVSIPKHPRQSKK